MHHPIRCADRQDRVEDLFEKRAGAANSVRRVGAGGAPADAIDAELGSPDEEQRSRGGECPDGLRSYVQGS